MKQQDWTEQLRQRLADHEEPLPEGLWAEIERRTAEQQAASTVEPQATPSSKRPSARLIALRRWMAAAAACALLLVGSWQLMKTAGDTADAPLPAKEQQTAYAQHEDMEEEAAYAQHEDMEEKAAQRYDERAAAHTETTALANRAENTEIKEDIIQSEHKETIEIAKPTDSDDPTKPDNPTASDSPTKTDNPIMPNNPILSTDPTRSSPTPSRRKQVQWQLHATNLLAYGSSSQTEPMLMTPSYMGAVSQALARTAPVYLNDCDEKTEHHLPFTLGVSLRIPLGERWWMATGINYTLATSTFTLRTGMSSQVNKQRLHYLGIPLSAGLTFWQTPTLTAYASCGAELQQNLKAEVDRGHLDRDRLQFSMLVSAGLEYRLLPQLGVYLQPGLRYYPDNGSHVRNIFKHRPLQPDLQLGIRFFMFHIR